jgi:hypothetical protein
VASNMAFNILVDLDSKAAAEKAEELRREMESLHDQRIRAEIDDAEFKVKYREIKAQLDVLATQHPNIQVRAEATRALMEMAAANREADKLDGRNVRIHIDDDGSSDLFGQRMGFAAQMAMALGPAIAAGIAPGIAALLAAGATVGALAQGFGALYAGLSGISAGVKELSTNQVSMAGRAEQSAAQQVSAANSIANAQDSLRTAIQNVGVAQETAALSVHRALEQEQSAHLAVEAAVRHQVNAEQSLVDAQHAALRAQQDLTQARVDAERSLQDMAFSVQDNALAQRRAQMDLEAAQKALANIAATDPRRAEAELTLQERQQRLTELQAQGQRLATDKASADAKGVEGSKQVTSAQDALTQANRQVITSQQSIVDASQAVFQAQQHERDAVDEVTRARVNGDRQIEAAHQSVVQAERGLSSALASQAAQADSTARTMDGLNKAMDNLSPAGQHFAHFLHDDVIPGLKGVRDGVQATLLPDLELALRNGAQLAPIFTAGLQGTASVLGTLAIRGSQMMTSGPWQSDFALIMGANNRALLGWGDAGLSALDVARNLIAAAIPLELHFAGVAEKSMATFAAWVQGKRDSGELAVWMGQMQEALSKIGHVLSQVAQGGWQLAQAWSGLGMAELSLIGNLAELLGWLAKTDPMLMQVAIVALQLSRVWGPLATGVRVAIAALEALTGLKIAASMGMATTAVTGFGLAIAGLGAAFVAASVIQDRWGTSEDKVTAGLLKGGQAAADAKQSLQSHGVVIDFLTGKLVGIGATLDNSTAAMNRQVAAMDPLTRAQTLAAKAQADYSYAIAHADYAGATAAQAEYAKQSAEVTRQQKIQHDAITSVTEALKEQQQQALDMSDADIRYGDALERATQSLKDHGRTTDLNTDAGRRNQSALNDLARAMQAQEDEMRKAGATEQMVTATHEQHRLKLRDVASQMGLNQTEAQKLTDKYLAIPNRINTDFWANTFPAWTEAHKLADGIRAALTGIQDENVTVKFVGAAPNDTGNITRATGGAVFGPGSETSDSIPALLSDNEHVWTAAEVKGAGGHGNVERLRHLAALGRIPAFASGGPANYSDTTTMWGDLGNVVATNVNYVKAEIEKLKRTLAEVPAGPAGAGVQRWAGMVDQALGIMHQPLSYRGVTLYQMQTESGGDPNIVNRWDSNWTAGTPSVGLMQVIGPTYRAHKVIDVGPYLYGVSVDPLANTLASMHYAIGRYGSLPAAYSGHGYANGGIIDRPSMIMAGEAGPEAILPLNRPHRAGRIASQVGLGGATVNVGPVHVHSDVDVDTLAHRLAFASSAAGL